MSNAFEEGDLRERVLDRLAERVQLEMCGSTVEDSFLSFVQDLRIPSVYGAKKFGDVIQPFQTDRFSQIAPSLEAVCYGQQPPVQRFWWEATKGCSKDADIGACLLWLIVTSKRDLEIQVGAADSGQAAIVKKRIQSILRINPDVDDKVDVIHQHIRNKRTGSDIQILSADRTGSHGDIPDVMVLNELSHVTNQEFFETLMDNAEKNPRGIVLIATNAGIKGSWHWTWRGQAETFPERWIMNIMKKPVPWITPESLADAERRNSPGRFRRLFHGEWTSGTGDALSEGLIDAAVDHEIGPMLGGEPGWLFTIGVDLGVSNDHSAVVALGVNPNEQRVRLAYARRWEVNPSTQEVDLMDVTNTINGVAKQFHPMQVAYDPSQAKLMAQILQQNGIPMKEMFFSGRNLDTMATTLIEVFRSRKFIMPYDPDFIADLFKLQIIEKPYGHKLDAVRDETGHADLATAFVIALPHAVELLKNRFYMPKLQDMEAFKSSSSLEKKLEELTRSGLETLGYNPDLPPF